MIGIIAFIAIFIAAYFAYKTANDNGRSGALWALATIGVGLACQLVFPIVTGLLLAVIYLARGVPQDKLAETINGPATIIGFVSWFLSFVGIWVVLRHISKLPKDEAGSEPPPPPTFEDQN